MTANHVSTDTPLDPLNKKQCQATIGSTWVTGVFLNSYFSEGEQSKKNASVINCDCNDGKMSSKVKDLQISPSHTSKLSTLF